jgi:hypothetical protein
MEWGKGMTNSAKIPSVISYSLPSAARERQWGFNISPDAVTMVNTKLELDYQNDKKDELELILYALDGMRDLSIDHLRASSRAPDFTWKSSENIVKDYFERVFAEIEKKFPADALETLPVDIVITIPVVCTLIIASTVLTCLKQWSYRAKNSTYRAITMGGFNNEAFPNLRDVIMVNEPEAAAIYTARYLQTKLGKNFLKVRMLSVISRTLTSMSI